MAPIRRTHPNFWLTLCSDLIVCFGAGLSLLLGPDEWRSARSFEIIGAIVPMRWHGVLLIIAGVLIWVGMTEPAFDRAMRAGLALAGLIGLYWTLGLLVAAGTHRLSGAFGPWVAAFFAINCWAQFGESRANPLTGR